MTSVWLIVKIMRLQKHIHSLITRIQKENKVKSNLVVFE